MTHTMTLAIRKGEMFALKRLRTSTGMIGSGIASTVVEHWQLCECMGASAAGEVRTYREAFNTPTLKTAFIPGAWEAYCMGGSDKQFAARRLWDTQCSAAEYPTKEALRDAILELLQ